MIKYRSQCKFLQAEEQLTNLDDSSSEIPEILMDS